MSQSLIPWIGIVAAALTSLSYIPQVRKAWLRGSTHDLSLKMLVALTTGLLLWIGYGLLKGDWVIVAATAPARRCREACSPSRSATFDPAVESSRAMSGRRPSLISVPSKSQCRNRSELKKLR